MSASVAVASKPKLRVPLKPQSVESPRDAIFECEFDLGEPPSTVTWYKDNKELREGRKYDITLRRGVASLVVHGTEGIDAGTFRAEASNKLGRVDTEGVLTVLSEYLTFNIAKQTLQLDVRQLWNKTLKSFYGNTGCLGEGC